MISSRKVQRNLTRRDSSIKPRESQLLDDLAIRIPIDKSKISVGTCARYDGHQDGTVGIIKITRGSGNQDSSVTFHAYYAHTLQKFTIHGSLGEIKSAVFFLADYKSR